MSGYDVPDTHRRGDPLVSEMLTEEMDAPAEMPPVAVTTAAGEAVTTSCSCSALRALRSRTSRSVAGVTDLLSRAISASSCVRSSETAVAPARGSCTTDGGVGGLTRGGRSGLCVKSNCDDDFRDSELQGAGTLASALA